MFRLYLSGGSGRHCSYFGLFFVFFLHLEIDKTASPFQLLYFRTRPTAAQPISFDLSLKLGPFTRAFVSLEATSYFTFSLWLCAEEPLGLVICRQETNSSLASLMEKQSR